MTEFMIENQNLIGAALYIVVFVLFLGARYLDKKAGNEGLIVTKTLTKTTIRNGWSRYND